MLMTRRHLPFFAAALSAIALALAGCESNALHQARMTDTPEVYEAFLQKYPDHEEAEWMRDRMEELRFMKAKDAGTSAALAEYIEVHPEGAHVKAARVLEDERTNVEGVRARLQVTPHSRPNPNASRP